jgi:hypothetical protein
MNWSTKKVLWFDRAFSFDLPDWLYPNMIERLRGAPACLEDRVENLTTEVLIKRHQDNWSIQENAGHLLDLEPLSMSRLDDFVAGRETLQPADLANRETHEADHNSRPISEILKSFRTAREELVNRFEELDEPTLQRKAQHPRLGANIRVIDLAYFVAEHDLHHLTRISELIRLFGDRTVIK